MGQFATLAVSAAIQLAQANRTAGAQNAAAEAAAQSQTEEIRRAQEVRERQRRERLRRVLAQQRAQFGAQGIRGGGSANAVLAGLGRETDRAIADDRGLSALRLNRIDDAFNAQRRRNLLELSDARQRTAFGLLQKGLGSISLLD